MIEIIDDRECILFLFYSRGKNLVEPSPAIQKELKQELEKVAKQHGGGEGIDLTKFPTFKFVDPVIDPINLETKK